jgi:hypothetical protein
MDALTTRHKHWSRGRGGIRPSELPDFRIDRIGLHRLLDLRHTL